MKLHGIELARLVGHGRERHVRGERDGDEAGRQLIDAVAVAHPDIEQRTALRVRVIAQTFQQPARRRGSHLRIAELAMRAGGDAPTELLRHRLHAIADAEDGHAQRVHDRRRLGRLLIGDGLRTARENDAPSAERAHFGIADVPGMDLAIHAVLADAPRDQLRVLRTEVEDEDAMRVDVRRVHGGCGERRRCIQAENLRERK